MRKSALIAFALVACAGLAALAAVAATDERRLAFTLGVLPGVPVELRPDSEACQRPVWVSEPFDRVQLQIGTYGRAGQPLAVSVRTLGGRELAQGRLGGGYPDVSRPDIVVGEVDRGRVAVCVENTGHRKVALYGGPSLAAVGALWIDGSRTETDATMVFLRDEPRSLLALLPDIFDHAAVFKPAWVGAWTFWLLAALLFAAVPVLLGAGLRAALRADGDAPSGAPATASAPAQERPPARVR